MIAYYQELLPVALRLAGRAAWYMPLWLRRLLPEIRFGHDAAKSRHDAAKPVAAESSV